MTLSRTALYLVIAWLCANACSSVDVKTDFDPEADFARFRTFAFGGLADTNKGGIFDNSLTRKRVESAVGRELTHKGLQRVEPDQHPDLLVYYWIGIQQKIGSENIGPTGGAYGWRGGSYGWQGAYAPPASSNNMTYEYKEGTLIVDLVEPGKKELVWRAMIVAYLEDTTKKNVELGEEGIAKAFEHYPPPNPSR